MKTTYKSTYATLLIGSAIAATSAYAAVINVTDFTQAPPANPTDGRFDVATPNGSVVNPNTNGSLVYYVTTFTFGSESQAHISTFWELSAFQDRTGITVEDTGLVSFNNDGDPGRTTFDINPAGNGPTLSVGEMAGQTVTMIFRSYFNTGNDALRATNTTGDDMLMNIWVNPTGSSTENTPAGGFGSNGVATANMLSDGDMQTLWNTSSYTYLSQRIQNQSTPGTGGQNSITNTRVFTGADATFANALAFATIPEPSTALLGGLGMLALLRRRR